MSCRLELQTTTTTLVRAFISETLRKFASFCSYRSLMNFDRTETFLVIGNTPVEELSKQQRDLLYHDKIAAIQLYQCGSNS